MKRSLYVSLAFASLFGVSSLCLADGYVTDAADSSSNAQRAALAPDKAKAMDQAAESPKENRIEGVTSEEVSIAVGHYARARSLLAAALREFDQGYKIAKPDSILDSKDWRDSIITRAEDLERILAPQARASRFGVRYEGDPRLLSTEAK